MAVDPDDAKLGAQARAAAAARRATMPTPTRDEQMLAEATALLEKQKARL